MLLRDKMNLVVITHWGWCKLWASCLTAVDVHAYLYIIKKRKLSNAKQNPMLDQCMYCDS